MWRLGPSAEMSKSASTDSVRRAERRCGDGGEVLAGGFCSWPILSSGFATECLGDDGDCAVFAEQSRDF